jgi:hypothetical protein
VVETGEDDALDNVALKELRVARVRKLHLSRGRRTRGELDTDQNR